MNFEDAALLRLADPATQRAVFDALALEHILDAAFVTSTLGVEGPFDATFDEVRFGAFAPTRALVEGGWSALGGADRTDTRIDVTWPDFGSAPRIDAVWRGSVIARAAVATTTVAAVSAVWPAVRDIDSDIVPLPADPAELEQARRAALRARLSAGAAQPAAVDAALVDKLLRQAGARTVGELIGRHHGEQATGRVRVTFADPSEPPPTPRSFPVSVALLVRDETHRLVDLLAQSKAVQWLLAAQIERAHTPELPARHPVVVGWVLPSTVLDDPAWPGAEPGAPPAAARLARRAAAAAWLAPEGSPS
ncbi:hypothetical protein ACFQ1L_34370 [Phytohabitans flavus]|uniref:hypothetical protein n=1 Tax=Phytohabitans flavus TaxID=1076124 RepID=UPI003635AD38